MPITLLFNLKKQFMNLIKEKIGELKEAIQSRINQFLLSLVEEITGSRFEERKEKGMSHALNYAANIGVRACISGKYLETTCRVCQR